MRNFVVKSKGCTLVEYIVMVVLSQNSMY